MLSARPAGWLCLPRRPCSSTVDRPRGRAQRAEARSRARRPDPGMHVRTPDAGAESWRSAPRCREARRCAEDPAFRKLAAHARRGIRAEVHSAVRGKPTPAVAHATLESAGLVCRTACRSLSLEMWLCCCCGCPSASDGARFEVRMSGLRPSLAYARESRAYYTLTYNNGFLAQPTTLTTAGHAGRAPA